MASLTSALSTAVQSLNADTSSLQITNNNIANANTPGYTREIPTLDEATPTQENNYYLGNGVLLNGYQSVRDELVNSQIQQETSSQSAANAQLSSLQQVQTTFTTSSNDIGTEMSAFFASISNLSTDPSDPADGQAVLTAGSNLTRAFNTAANTLSTQQAALNQPVTQDVAEINQLSQQIAALNPQIAELTSAGQDGGQLEDQQDELLQKLSALTSVAITATPEGPTVTTGNGTALVVGNKSYALSTATNSSGNQDVFDSEGNDITSTLTGGDLGGTIQTRDQAIPGLQNQLDTLANQFATAVNAAQAKGYDQTGTAGTNFFNIPSTVSGSAAAISMAITTPAQIATSSDGTSGSNGNLANLSAVQTSPLPSGTTPGDAYAGIVYQVGSLTDNANSEYNATSSSLEQLNDQLNSVSGVSLDEEAENMIQYQTAYEAAARVVTTVQALITTTMSMGTAAAE
jgi:flagellar hook-associated protein 1 FlgK